MEARTVPFVLNVHAHMFGRVKEFVPENHAAAVPKAEFEDLLRFKSRMFNKKCLVLIHKFLRLVENKMVVSAAPGAGEMLETINLAVENHPILPPLEPGEKV